MILELGAGVGPETMFVEKQAVITKTSSGTYFIVAGVGVEPTRARIQSPATSADIVILQCVESTSLLLYEPNDASGAFPIYYGAYDSKLVL